MKTLVIAPHPDDETFGCAGTLLRRKTEGGSLGWLIVTGISEAGGWSLERVKQRDTEIAKVGDMIGFSEVYNLRLPTTRLDQLPIGDIIQQFATVFMAFQPEEVFVPNHSDVHTDHHIVFDATVASVKSFRHPFVRRVLAYETLSETDFGLDAHAAFYPNFFVDISGYLERKLEVMAVYQSELGVFPFPRSVEAIRALATLRGATAGCVAAEAFHLLREHQ